MSAADKPQSYSSHSRYVPGFHFVTGSVIIVILVWAIYRLVTLRTSAEVPGVLVAAVLLAQFIYLRQFPLAVQDRLIRLEEQLRLERLMPDGSRALIEALTPNQLIALRFASDVEVAALATRVVNERIDKRSAIKALIRNWRPDHMRA